MVGYPASSHEAVRLAAANLAEALSLSHRPAEGPSGCDFFLCVGSDINLEIGPRSFHLDRVGKTLRIVGDRPRSVVAAAAYWLHHRAQGHALVLPLTRRSPYADRLIMEDFPFMCYAPTGFAFDLDRYAGNLAAMGFTAMECNRFSTAQPMGPRHWNYAFTNPSPSAFVWTKWHEGAFDRQVVEANARELERCIAAAQRWDLAPTLTSFLPRPYPESFFAAHPDWRGPGLRNSFMEASGHAAVHTLDTDHPEVQAFYRQVYADLFDRFPGIGHLFFWHGDLGTQFWADGEGRGKHTRVERIAGFHRMLAELLAQRGMTTRVWLNPWHLTGNSLDTLHEKVPASVGFSIKDNPGLDCFAGTTPITLPDATIINASLGAIPKKILEWSRTAGRLVCLGQYMDFSEDLDPVLAVPHPLMTFRKFQTLAQVGQNGASAAHWGILSPEVAPVNPNRDVIREMQWGHPARVFDDLFDDLVPGTLTPAIREAVREAWQRVDQALRLWPQFWGLRLQDSGLRLRWLVRPFGFGIERLSASDRAWYLDRQIYALDAPDPFGAFMNIDASQGREVAREYGDMTALLSQALALLAQAQQQAATDLDRSWLTGQTLPLITLRHFWATYHHLFTFYGYREKALGGDETARARCTQAVNDEIANVAATRIHFQANPKTVIIAQGGAWGQCLGPDVDDNLARKESIMRAYAS